MEIEIFTLGGTIDKIYFDANSEFQVGDPQIGDLLREANVTFDYSVESLMRKDSLDMTDADRSLVCERVEQASPQHILITHGTDTMVDTCTLSVETTPSFTFLKMANMIPSTST